MPGCGLKTRVALGLCPSPDPPVFAVPRLPNGSATPPARGRLCVFLNVPDFRRRDSARQCSPITSCKKASRAALCPPIPVQLSAPLRENERRGPERSSVTDVQSPDAGSRARLPLATLPCLHGLDRPGAARVRPSRAAHGRSFAHSSTRRAALPAAWMRRHPSTSPNVRTHPMGSKEGTSPSSAPHSRASTC
jgi:hypothetical protein